jgi:hypothetical protein
MAQDPSIVAGNVGGQTMTLSQLEQQLQSGAITPQQYQQMFGQLTSQGTPNQEQTQMINAGGTDFNTFMSQFQNLTGQAPTAQAINDYFTNIAPTLTQTPGMAGNTADVSNLINTNLSQQFQPQIQAQGQNTQANNMQSIMNSILGTGSAPTTGQAAPGTLSVQGTSGATNGTATMPGGNGLLGQMLQSQLSQLTNPQSMQQIEGSLNNSGMLNSGAFSSTLANDLAGAGQSDIQSLLSGIIQPGLSTQLNTANDPYTSYLSGLPGGTTAIGGTQQNQTNFNEQSQLAQMLAGIQQPSTLQQLAPILQGLMQGGGTALSGYFQG